MRTTKFRCWSNNLNEMFYDNITFEKNGGQWWHQFERIEGIAISRTNSLNGIVMQFTGLKDKNGKEIYEGDIIETEHEARGIVIWDKLATQFVCDCNEPMWEHPIHSMGGEKEIIGNIFQDKNLI